MQKKYEIHGMSCGGCVSNVKRALSQIPNVEDVEVQLQPPVANITMSNFIDVNELQVHLNKAGRYTIKEIESQKPIIKN